MTVSELSSSQRHNLLERFFNIFAKVHAREGLTSLLLLLNIFLILVAYYMIKPVREGWLSVSVIAGLSKIEVKAYSACMQSVLLVLILPLYSLLAKHLPRSRLLSWTGNASAFLLVVFWVLQPGYIFGQVPYAGVGFYIFVGIFSVTLVAQFWSFASDLYGEERGRRLFPLIAIGAAAGSMAGSALGEQLLRIQMLRPYDLILLATVPLLAALALARRSDLRGTLGEPSNATVERWDEAAAPKDRGPFSLIFQHQYLSAIAVTILLFNWIVSSGDNILYGLIQQALEQQMPADMDLEQKPLYLQEATTAFYSSLYFWINLVGLLLQAFLVSRIFRYGGFSLLLIITPIISLIAYISMAVAPVLGLIKFMKIAEISTNFSINNTARHMLWLPTTKEMLYQAKTTVDTLFVRFGDGLAALTVLVGIRYLDLSLLGFLVINIVLSIIWLGLAIYLTREYKRWSAIHTEVA